MVLLWVALMAVDLVSMSVESKVSTLAGQKDVHLVDWLAWLKAESLVAQIVDLTVERLVEGLAVAMADY